MTTHATRLQAASLLLALAVALGGCGLFKKQDGSAATPIERAKVAQKAADTAWKEVQLVFATARQSAEQSEKVGRALRGSEITAEQWAKFVDVDRKVLASGRSLAALTLAVETGVKKDAGQLGALTADLLRLFREAKDLAAAFGLKIPALPEASPAPSSALPLLLLAAGLAVPPRRLRIPPPIAGGAGEESLAVIATAIAGEMVNAAGPAVGALIAKNPGDQRKAEAAAALLGAFLTGLAARLPGLIESARDPSSINLLELWDESAEELLERLRAASS